MTYNECSGLANSSIGFYKAQSGKTYYYCIPSDGSGPIPGPPVSGLTKINGSNDCTWICPDGTTVVVPNCKLTGNECKNHGGFISEPVTITPNQHGNMTVTYQNGTSHGLAFTGNGTVSYPLTTTSIGTQNTNIANPSASNLRQVNTGRG